MTRSTNVKLLVLAMATGTFGNFLENIIEPRVVNGTDASPGEYPYVVSIQEDEIHACGGTIVNKFWILTAGHCRPKEEAGYDYSIVAGTNLWYENSSRRAIEYFVPHPNFTANIYGIPVNDLGLYKLLESLEYTSLIQPVTLPSPDSVIPGGTSAYVAGWGLNETTQGWYTDTLQEAEIFIYSDEDCEAMDWGFHPSRDYDLCAGVAGGGRGECLGDSGGPLVTADAVQVGIVSWSLKMPGCVSPGYPGVYTKVARFVDWIKNVTAL